MAVRLRTIADFAKEIGKDSKTALALLSAMGVRVIDNTFDQNRLEAAYKEPKWLRTRRNEWSLSHATGLGAVKYLLDPLKITIVQHECKGAQWLMLEGPTRKRQYVKMYYTGKLANPRNPGANFQVRNFYREDAPAYYVMVSFEGPHIWAVPTRELCKCWHKSRYRGASHGVEGFSMPAGLEDHKYGALNVYLHTNSKFIVTDLKQLGLV